MGDNGIGVYGFSAGTNGYGVIGNANAYGGWFEAYDDTGTGVYGSAQGTFGTGVHGIATGTVGNGVQGEASASGGKGIVGIASGSNGVGSEGNAFGSNGIGILGYAPSTGYAGYFNGNVYVAGTLTKSSGSFKIDHPIDPENRYLSHSFVESPDMKNIYDGVTVLDDKGEAWVELPEWFETLNRDFRYQLTAILAPGPSLYIAEEILNNRFKIAGGTPNMKISWMVTGIRKDPYANAHRIAVEKEKLANEKGLYLHPEAYGQPEEKGMNWVHDKDNRKWLANKNGD